MKLTNICFCLKDDQVLLAMKKRGFGAGKWNGYGGKVQGAESIRAATVREVREESGLIIYQTDLKQVAVINFYFADELVFECHVFFANQWSGEPVETEEMRPQWFPADRIPYSEMWADDDRWLPLVLSGKKIKAECYFSKEGDTVENFSWEETDFS